jgi:hypothetical protein
MRATQVRISDSTRETLRTLAKQKGESMQDIVEKAVEVYRRKTFLEGLSQDFLALRDDKDAWADEEEERSLWENAVEDGLEKE